MRNSGEFLRTMTRRHFLSESGLGIGIVALSALMNERLSAAEDSSSNLLTTQATKEHHFRPKAKNIIYLFMEGGPSQLDLFDYKPKLRQYDRQTIPEEL